MAVDYVFQAVLGSTMPDTYLQSPSPNLPTTPGIGQPVEIVHGAETGLWLGRTTAGQNHRILIDIDIRSLIGKMVSGVKLELFGIGVDAGNVAGQPAKCRIQLPSADGGLWPRELEATWPEGRFGSPWDNSFGGGDYTTVDESDFVMPPAIGGDLLIQGVGLNVAAAAALAAPGGTGWLRLLLMLTHEGITICAHQFASREYATDTTKQPKLTITTPDPAGSIKTIITPAEAVTAGAKWSLASDATERDSGATAGGLAVGAQAVKFKTGIANFEMPADIPVVVNDGQVDPVTGNYVATGSVKITLTDAAAVTAGAKWRLDTDAPGVWRDSDEVATGVPVGKRTVSYNGVASYAKPDDTEVTVAGGGTAIGTTAFGAGSATLFVNASYTGAKVWRGRWRWMGGAWNDRWVSITISPGTYDVIPGTPTIEFESNFGFDDIAVDSGLPFTVADAGTAIVSVFPVFQTGMGWRGFSLVTMPAGSGWRDTSQDGGLPAGVWRLFGTLSVDTFFSVFTAIFRPVTGWVTPSPVLLRRDNDGVPLGGSSYINTGADGDVAITIAPGGAITAGGQWKLRHEDPGVWHDSGFLLTPMPQGTYDVDFKAITGYTAPASFQVTVTSGGSATGTGTYVSTGATVTGVVTPAPPNIPTPLAVQFKIQDYQIGAGSINGLIYDSGWLDPGTPVTNAPQGIQLIISFSDLAGWVTPLLQVFILSQGDSLVLIGAYTGSPNDYIKAAVARIDSISDYEVLPSDSGGEQIVINTIMGTAHCGVSSVNPPDGGAPDTREDELRFYELVFIRMLEPDNPIPLPAYIGDNMQPKDTPVYIYRVYHGVDGLFFTDHLGSASQGGGEPVDNGGTFNLVRPGKPVILPSGAYMVFVCAVAKLPFRDGWISQPGGVVSTFAPQFDENTQTSGLPDGLNLSGEVNIGLISRCTVPGVGYGGVPTAAQAAWSCYVSMLFADFDTDLRAVNATIFQTAWRTGLPTGGRYTASWFRRKSWKNLSGSTSTVTETEPLRTPVTSDGRMTVPAQDPNLAPSLFLVADDAVVFARFNQLKWST